MTHRIHPSVSRDVVQLLAEHGFDGMAQAMQLLLNECMKIERQQALGVGPYERSEERHGQANGFKPKTVQTRMAQVFPWRPRVGTRVRVRHPFSRDRDWSVVLF